MRTIDLDIDFFLADCCHLALPGKRPPLEGCEPWEKDAVCAFLENNCGLSRKDRIPGRIYDTHDGSLRFWGELIGEGKLTAPFSVTHIDAHSDLGIGAPGPGVVLDGVLPVKIEKRVQFERYYERQQLDEANYLLFALAFRWIDCLENVRNPRSRYDFPKELKPDDVLENEIRLSSFASRLLEGVNGREPTITYIEYSDPYEFKAKGKYDFMSVARSLRYAPKEADELLPVIAQYMELI